MRKWIEPILIAALALANGCGVQSSTTPQTAERLDKAIEAELDYSIIDDSKHPPIKRSLNIRLAEKVSEDTLRDIAKELKQTDSAQYERTFIVYYLPDMEVGAGGWATSHFYPDLDVRILGLTAEQEVALSTDSGDPTREVVGNWLDDRPTSEASSASSGVAGKSFWSRLSRMEAPGRRRWRSRRSHRVPAMTRKRPTLSASTT